MVEMQSARLKRADVTRHLLEARDFSRVRLHDFVEKSMEKFTKYDLEHGYPCIADIKVILRDIAEQLKGGGMDG